MYITKRLLIPAVLIALSGAWPFATVFAEQLTIHIVNPQATDPAIDEALDNHYAWVDPTAPTNGQLFLYMPGTADVPANALLIQEMAARLGYHVIGLMYVDDTQIQGLCAGQPDPSACSYDSRFEILTGQDVSPLVDVNVPNSIDNRLTKLLQYLAANYPHEGWSTFLDDGDPRWSTIAAGGWSQGGAHAAFIAKLRRVARVVMFSAPVEDYGGVPPAWESTGHATPAGRYFGLAHDRDGFYPGIVGGWTALGMDVFGAEVQVEKSTPPYASTHELFTELPPQRGGYAWAHYSTVLDALTPLFQDKTPRLGDASTGSERNPMVARRWVLHLLCPLFLKGQRAAGLCGNRQFSVGEVDGHGLNPAPSEISRPCSHPGLLFCMRPGGSHPLLGIRIFTDGDCLQINRCMAHAVHRYSRSRLTSLAALLPDETDRHATSEGNTVVL